MVAVVDMGSKVKTIGRIEAYLLNSLTCVVELYESPTQRVDVDTSRHKVTLVRAGVAVCVFKKGEMIL